MGTNTGTNGNQDPGFGSRFPPFRGGTGPAAPEPPTPTSHRLREARRRRSFSQREAAELVDVSQRAWAAWEAGTHLPGPDARHLLAFHFGLCCLEESPRQRRAHQVDAAALDALKAGARTRGDVARALGVSYAVARAALARLTAAGIVHARHDPARRATVHTL